MEIKDIMEQEIREIKLLTILREILVERSTEYDREHPRKTYAEDCVIRINDRPSFGLKDIDLIIRENYNILIEWLTEDMTEMSLHDLFENNEFLDFWDEFKRKARYEQEQFIKERSGDELNKLYFQLKHSDILEVAYNKIEKELNEFNKQMEEAPVDDGGPCVYDPHSFRNKEQKQ